MMSSQPNELKMNLLHVIDIFDSRYEYDQVMLTQKLSAKGHNVDVLCSNYLLGGLKASNTYESNAHGVEVWRHPSIKLKIPTLKPIYIYNCSALLSKYDIVHVYSLYTYASLIGPLLKKRVKAKLVLRSEIGSNESDTYNKTVKNPIYVAAFRYICTSADAITAYTDKECDALLSLGINRQKIHIIPVGVNFQKFSKIQLKNVSPLTVGYFGRISPEKGVHRIIPLAKKIAQNAPNIHFIVAGFFEKRGYGEFVVNQLRHFNALYLGSLDSDSNTEFYSRVNIVLVPSYSETGAIGVLEAMASGCIVIATNIYPINQYIKHGKNGFLVSGENYANEAYEIIYSLLKDGFYASKVASAAILKAKQFDWDHLVLKYEQLYQKLTVKR